MWTLYQRSVGLDIHVATQGHSQKFLKERSSHHSCMERSKNCMLELTTVNVDFGVIVNKVGACTSSL